MTEIIEEKGVQQLMDRLKNQGKEAGEIEAKKILQNAKVKASELITDAKSKIDAMQKEAKEKIDSEKLAANEAIKIAFRDAEMTLRNKFREEFSQHVKRLISKELQDTSYIKELVLKVAGAKKEEIDKAEKLEILTPSESLKQLVLGISHEVLRSGVDLKPSNDFQGGIRVRLVNEKLEIDLTDEAISELLLTYLLPRYRDIVTGNGSKL